MCRNSFHKFFFFIVLVLSFRQATVGKVSGFTFPDQVLTNVEYASKCKADGWNIEKLNTASASDYLNDEEKNLILATNMVRSDPAKFAELYVKEIIDIYLGKVLVLPSEISLQTQEGKLPAMQLYRVLLKTKPMNILFPSKGMSLAAKDHAQSQSASGRTGHGPGNAGKRLMNYGKWEKCMGENIAYGYTTAHYALLALLIDDGVPSRGHRQNILNPEFRKIGVGSATHRRYGWSFVVTYACDYTDAAR